MGAYVVAAGSGEGGTKSCEDIMHDTDRLHRRVRSATGLFCTTPFAKAVTAATREAVRYALFCCPVTVR